MSAQSLKSARKLERDEQVALLLCLIPCLMLIFLVLLVPLAEFLSRSVFDPEPTLEHFRQIVERDVYQDVILRTFRICAVTTAICLVLGYPVAYVIASSRGWQRMILLALVLIPFWTSVLVRMFAWMSLLGLYGPANQAFLALGLTQQPVRMLFNEGAVVLGMVHYLLPYMILPCLAVMAGIPDHMMKAALGLGAPRWRAFLWIYLPLSSGGAAAGCLLVFIISIGFFVTPALLGGPRDLMLAQLLEQEIGMRLDWGMGAALSVMLVAITLLLYAIYHRVARGAGVAYD